MYVLCMMFSWLYCQQHTLGIVLPRVGIGQYNGYSISSLARWQSNCCGSMAMCLKPLRIWVSYRVGHTTYIQLTVYSPLCFHHRW